MTSKRKAEGGTVNTHAHTQAHTHAQTFTESRSVVAAGPRGWWGELLYRRVSMTLEEWEEHRAGGGGGRCSEPRPISAQRSLLLSYSQPPASHPRSVETNNQ